MSRRFTFEWISVHWGLSELTVAVGPFCWLNPPQKGFEEANFVFVRVSLVGWISGRDERLGELGRSWCCDNAHVDLSRVRWRARSYPNRKLGSVDASRVGEPLPPRGTAGVDPPHGGTPQTRERRRRPLARRAHRGTQRRGGRGDGAARAHDSARAQLVGETFQRLNSQEGFLRILVSESVVEN